MSNQSDFNPGLIGQVATGFRRAIRDLLLPSNAAPSTPRVFIGPDIPAGLVSFYSPNTPVACVIAYNGLGGYHYIVWVQIASTGENIQAEGFVANDGVTVWETILQYFDPTSGIPITVTIGEAFGNPGLNNFQLIVDGSSSFEGPMFIDGGATPPAAITYATNVQTDGQQEFTSAYLANYDAGSILNLLWFGDLKMDPNGVAGLVSQRRGPFGTSSATGTATTPTGGAGNLFTYPTVTYRNGRAFRLTFLTTWSASVANSFATFWLNTGVGANVLGLFRSPALPVGASQENWCIPIHFEFTNQTGADVTTGMQVQIIAPGGVQISINGSGRLPSQGLITDEGDATKVPWVSI